MNFIEFRARFDWIGSRVEKTRLVDNRRRGRLLKKNKKILNCQGSNENETNSTASKIRTYTFSILGF
ncbi:hypothetical protein MtrunA17_Chr1g0149931 [Medicago truncatula]|uniref:Uncharacterized protein n=1 Tax=Medicago truncatula TaxID=3880 RepID=A0A396JJT2_MEDTR|nr:hypothetical protein MtrunA17_Chr1g0149931 [Medicago truncatula]